MRDFVRVDVSACLMGAFLLLTLPSLFASELAPVRAGSGGVPRAVPRGGNTPSWRADLGRSHRRGRGGDGDGTLKQRQRAGLRSGRPRRKSAAGAYFPDIPTGGGLRTGAGGFQSAAGVPSGRRAGASLRSGAFLPKTGKSNCCLDRTGNTGDIGRSRAGSHILLETGNAAPDGGNFAGNQSIPAKKTLQTDTVRGTIGGELFNEVSL